MSGYTKGMAMALLSALVALLIGCGGSSSTTSTTKEDGRVMLRNDTKYHIKATYVTPTGEPIQTDIESGAEKVITGEELIPGGTEAIIQVHVDAPYLIDREFKVPVDGNVTLWIKRVVGRHDLETEMLS